MSVQWEDEAEEALQRAGFTVIERAGINDDGEGWGCLLASSGKKWAVCSWSYGSCSGCDPYMDMSDDEIKAAFDNEIEVFDSEEKARQIFDDRKGW